MLMCLDKFGEDEKGGKRPAEIGLLLINDDSCDECATLSFI